MIGVRPLDFVQNDALVYTGLDPSHFIVENLTMRIFDMVSEVNVRDAARLHY